MPASVPLGKRLPVVIALHGRGEAMKGPEAGAWGWPRDYALTAAFERLLSPPLTTADFQGFVTPSHLSLRNEALRAEPLSGLIVVCPYLPDEDPASGFTQTYATFLVDELVPRIARELPADASRLGIDGVSLGGAVALRVGLLRPQFFRSVGAIQPAISSHQVEELVKLTASVKTSHPKLRVRVMTSEGDSFRPAIEAYHRALGEAGIAHDFFLAPGPHDYAFNRGPGAIELLFWHERVLTAR
jgi:pimeloyl-ACP methyl ester carboxylesterase